MCLTGHVFGVSLDGLIDMALCSNPEIHAAQEHLVSTEASCRGRHAAFQPHVSFEFGHASEHLNVRSDDYQYGYIGASWNLYHGGRDSASTRIGCSERRIASSTLYQIQNQVIHQLCRSFYDLLYCDHAIRHLDEIIASLPGTQAIAKRKWENGLTSELDCLEFELEQESLCSTRAALLTARHQAVRQLSLLTGCDIKDDVVITGEFITCGEIDDVCSLYARALEQRLDRSISAEQLQILLEEYNQAFGEGLPKVDLIGSYGKEPDTRSDRGTGTKFFFNVSIPIYSGFETKNKVVAARHRLEAQRYLNSNLDNRILAEIQTGMDNLALQRSRLQAETAIFEKNQKYLSMTKQEYEKGIKNSPDLSSARERTLQSHLRLLSIQRDISHTLLSIAIATGDSIPSSIEKD